VRWFSGVSGELVAYLWLWSSDRPVVEVVEDLVIGLVFLFAVFFAFPFCRLALQRQILALITAVVLALVLPFFSTVVGIALAVVVHHEVILVESASDHFLVAVFVDFIVDGTLVFHLVRVEPRLARGSLGAELGECGSMGHADG
jgi:uncharacterized membrane protein